MTSNEDAFNPFPIGDTPEDPETGNPNDKNPRNQTPPKKAYIERALYSYLKSFYSQGYKLLMGKEFRGFFYYVIGIIIASTTMNILNALNIFNNQTILQHVTLVCLMTGISLILGGLVGGILKNQKFQTIFTVLLLVASIVTETLLFVFSITVDFTAIWLEAVKLVLFLTYVGIGTFSYFFIIISFVTAISYRLINLGNSPNRLLFQGILRLVVWISLPMYGYLIYQGSLDAQILGVGGIIVAIIILYRYYHLPSVETGENFTERTNMKANINYHQVIGFYYLYLLYHLSQSFNTSSEITNLALNFFLLTVNTLFMINTLSKKVDNIQEEEELQRAFMFQRKTGISVKIKQFIGERGLILMMLGLALGYYGVYLDSYLGNNLNLIIFISDVSRTVPLNATYHRLFLGIGLVVIVGTMLAFHRSIKFQGIFVNRYTFRHVWKMFGDLFRINEEGTTGQILKTVQNGKHVLNESLSNVKKGLKRSWNSMFNMGKQPHPDEDKEQE